MEYLYAADSVRTNQHQWTHKYIKWKPPNPQILKPNIDRLAKVNQGTRGIGGVFRNVHGDWVIGFIKHLIRTSSLEVEMLALWLGLQLAIKRGFLRLEIETDSQMVITLVNQIHNKRYRNLTADCRLLLDKLQF